MKSIFEKINDGDPTARAILITIQDCKRLCREGVQRGWDAGCNAVLNSAENKPYELKNEAVNRILNGPKRKAKSK